MMNFNNAVKWSVETSVIGEKIKVYFIDTQYPLVYWSRNVNKIYFQYVQLLTKICKTQK
jgi:hypothetical protein